MKLEDMIEAIKQTEADIKQLDNLHDSLAADGAKAGISCRGSWTVHFPPAEVAEILSRRRIGLQVKIGRLQEAKKAAEITMEGWINQSGWKNEQKGTE